VPELTDEIVQQLLPEGEPSRDSVPDGIGAHELAALADSLQPQARRIFLWQTALQARVERERWNRQVPGFQYATFGFVPIGANQPPPGLRTAGGYVFGVAIEVEPDVDGSSQQVQLFVENRASIARVINRRRVDLDVAHPITGTGACWARSKKSAMSPPRDGVLTAEHVVAGLPLGAAVSMSQPGPWFLGDCGTCKIDAALIVKRDCIPSSAKKLVVQTNPIAYTHVEILGAASPSPIRATITHSLVYPNDLSDRNPMRVFLDTFGKKGDSGALVWEQRTHAGVGIYMGTDPVSLGISDGKEGVAQALVQATDALQLDVFL
jgi:hypothetical protein